MTCQSQRDDGGRAMVADCTAQHTRVVPVAVAVESRSGQRGAISKRVLASDGQASAA